MSESVSCHGEHTIDDSLELLLSLLVSQNKIDETWARVHKQRSEEQ